jgi:hypothetical protein
LRQWSFYGRLLLFAVMICLLEWSAPATRTVPVQATLVSKEITTYMGRPFLDLTYRYEVAGKTYTSGNSHYLNPGEKAVALPEETSRTLWINAAEPETAVDVPRPHDPLGNFLRAAFFPGCYLMLPLFLSMWQLWVAASRMPAAGSRRKVPGQSVWIRLKWCDRAFLPLFHRPWLVFIAMVAFIVCKDTMGIGLGATTFFLSLGLVLTGLMYRKRHCSLDITADLHSGTLRVPLYSEEDRAATVYRTLPLADASSFTVTPRKKESSDGSGSPACCDEMQLTLCLKGGETIPLAVFGKVSNTPFYATIIDEYGVQLIAWWLNDQFGLPQPRRLQRLTRLGPKREPRGVARVTSESIAPAGATVT